VRREALDRLPFKVRFCFDGMRRGAECECGERKDGFAWPLLYCVGISGIKERGGYARAVVVEEGVGRYGPRRTRMVTADHP